MAEALWTLALGSMVLVTVSVVWARPVRGPAVLGLAALVIATVCLVAAAFMPHGPGIDVEFIPGIVVALVGMVHFAIALILLAVSWVNRHRRTDHS